MVKETLVKVTAAVLVQNGRLLIAKRKPNLKLAYFWELPGGKVEAGETPETCIRRELKEEFDIEVIVGEYLGSNIHHYTFGAIELMGYRVFYNSGVLKPMDHSQVAWVTVDRLDDYVFTPADVPIIEKLRRGEIAI
jgi:8-oxo-dGTP diphosphatase